MNALLVAAALTAGHPPFPPPYPGVPFPPPVPAAPTVEQFAAGFQPTPGTHHVVILHPSTGRPVPVCFTLPAGFPRIDFGKRHVEYDFGKLEVTLRFRSNGTVEVDYDD